MFYWVINASLSLPFDVPCISESCVKIKIKLNFYFHTSFWCLKGFHKTFGGTTKKCENKNITYFFSSSGIGTTGRVKNQKKILDNLMINDSWSKYVRCLCSLTSSLEFETKICVSDKTKQTTFWSFLYNKHFGKFWWNVHHKVPFQDREIYFKYFLFETISSEFLDADIIIANAGDYCIGIHPFFRNVTI